MMMNMRSRRAYIAFYDAVQSWSSITESQSIRTSRNLQKRTFVTNVPLKASMQVQYNDQLNRIGMSSLISPFRNHALQRQNSVTGISASIKDSDLRLDQIPSTSSHQSAKAEHAIAIRAILKSTWDGQIIQAMSKIYEAVLPLLEGRPSKSALKVDRYLFTKMIQAMSKVGRSYGAEWDNIIQSTSNGSFWKPSLNPSGTKFNSIPVQTLALYAIASLYDMASTLNFLPSAASQASALRTLSMHLDINTFEQCLSMMLLQLSGVPFHEAQLMAMNKRLNYEDFNCSSIPSDIVAAVIDSFGTCGKPKRGERFLLWWVVNMERATVDSKGSIVIAKMPSDFEMGNSTLSTVSWREDEFIWSALIRARGKVGDINGARHWLQEYRRLANDDERNGAPYLEYLRCCASSGANEQKIALEKSPWLLNSGQGAQRSLYHDALEMLKADRISVDEKSLSFLINFEVGHGEIQKAAELIFEAYDTLIVRDISPSIYKALYRLHKQCALKSFGKSKPFDCIDTPLSEKGSKRIGPINDLRKLFCFFVSRIYFENKWRKEARIEALDHALEASVAIGDLPLAFVIEKLVKNMDGQFGFKSQNTTLSWLKFCQYGFGGVHQYPINNPSSRQFSRSWSSNNALSRNEMAIKAAHKRLQSMMPSPQKSQDGFISTTGSPSMIEEGQNEMLEPNVGFLIERHLVQSVHQAMKDKPNSLTNCSPWLQDLCMEIQATGEIVNDDEILRMAARQVLLNEEGNSRVKNLTHLL